ncbi:EthD family reductase [Rhodococcus wratislaviensis]|uniref:EthD family reductase n=1 Tax=Rhodococcus wratislaviensis TaxID=44752 RepID=UPI003664CC28
MIRLSVFYPASDGKEFDYDYYRDSHVPLCLRTWGIEGSSNAYEVDRGVDGPFVAAFHIRFESRQALNAALAAPGNSLVDSDVVNYTSISPIAQISEVQ